VKITNVYKLLLSATTMTMLVTVVGAGHKFF
jgi:hypothetical protein